MANPIGENLQFLNSLAPFVDQGYGTGALLLTPDPRDFQMHRIPEVKAMLEAGAPASYDLITYIKGVYNQGQVSSCVAHSTAGMKSVEDMLEHSAWNTYDAPALYAANGGTGQNGVDTRRVLQYAQDTGLLVLQGTARYRIGSYAFAPRVAGQFEDTLKAAIAANRPCVLALLLPQNFGWDSSGAMTQGYHQVAIVGFDATYVTILNSWGSGWGKNGLGRIPWSYLTQQNFQSGYVYAYTVIDALDGDLQPPVNKPPVAVPGGPYRGAVRALVQFDGSGSSDPDGTIVRWDWDFGDGIASHIVNPNHVYIASGAYTVTLTVTDNLGATSTATTTATISAVPPPPALMVGIVAQATPGGASAVVTVTDVRPLPAGSTIAAMVQKPNGESATVSTAIGDKTVLFANAGGPYTGIAGVPVQFDGSKSTADGTIVKYAWGFGDGGVGVTSGPAYSYATPGIYKVILIVTDVSGVTASATTTATITLGPPPPPGELKLTGTIVRLGQAYAAYATVVDPSGASIAGTVLKCVVGATALPDRTISGAGSPAIWAIATSLLAPGTVVKISAAAPDGRKGELSLIFLPAN